MFRRVTGILPAGAKIVNRTTRPTKTFAEANFEISARAGSQAFQAILRQPTLGTRHDVKIAANNFGEAVEAAEHYASFTGDKAVTFYHDGSAIDLDTSPSAAPRAISELNVSAKDVGNFFGRYAFYTKNGWSEKEIERHEKGLALGLAPHAEIAEFVDALTKKYADETLSSEEKSQIARGAGAYWARADAEKFSNHKILVKLGEEVFHIRNVNGAAYDVSAVANKFARESAAISAAKLDAEKGAEEILR